MENPDYVADWRLHAGPTVREAPPHVFRRQTEASSVEPAGLGGPAPSAAQGMAPPE